MKITIIIIAVLAVLGVGAFVFSQNSSKSSALMSNEDESAEPINAMMRRDDSSTVSDSTSNSSTSDSRYVEYSNSILDSSSGRRVLFFYASWCPTCIPADAGLRRNSGDIPEDLTIIRVNYNDPDTDQDEEVLAKKYGVTYQHTFVQIDESGEVVTKWNGGGLEELLSRIK